MMYARIIANEVRRKKGALTVVFAFILLSALLVAGGAGLLVNLTGALDSLFEAAEVPHFVQMHAGEIDSAALEEWAEANSLVAAYQIEEMITLDGSALYLGNQDSPEENSVMDISLVAQNEGFDFLLDLNNRKVELAPGEVGVPVYYMEEAGLQPGQSVRISEGEFSREYRVAAIIRDAQMNPAIVHSKRFLFSSEDYEELGSVFSEREYLIAFRLTDLAALDEFSAAYAEAGLPDRGPAIDIQLFRVLNALSEGIVAAVVIILSLLLILIAMLCLRFTILATLEEDYREIGVMKAIGMPRRSIKRLYLAKYLFLGFLATAGGYLLSLPLARTLTESTSRYLGTASLSVAQLAIPAAAAVAILLAVTGAAAFVLRRFGRISAVSALRASASTEAPRSKTAVPLRWSGPINLNLFLGFRDALLRLKLFGLLLVIFFFAAAITLVPLHFLTTMRSPSFVSYMGIGSSDLRIDLRQSEGMEGRFADLLAQLRQDDEIARFSPLVTAQYTLLRENGETEGIAIENGDFTLFPLDYLRGSAPTAVGEIAVSHLLSGDLEAGVGDTLTIVRDGERRELTVSGVYQDVTNGGRTAKAKLPYDTQEVLAYTVSVDLKEGVAPQAKVHEYAEAFHPARVTDLESYLEQTLGNTISQLRSVTIGAVLLGLAISALITSLFLRMLISKDARRIAVLKAIGFSVGDVRSQYVSTASFLLIIGLGLGTLFANTGGEGVVSFLWGFMGASRISFIVEALKAYLLVPLLLLGTVGLTTLLSVRGIKDQTVAATIAE